MSRDITTNVPRLFNLSDEEAVTLRRIAFGQSEIRSLRPADIERLLRLRLISSGGRNSMVLTVSGKEHFESLPRPVFTAAPRQRDKR